MKSVLLVTGGLVAGFLLTDYFSNAQCKAQGLPKWWGLFLNKLYAVDIHYPDGTYYPISEDHPLYTYVDKNGN